jgi:anaerobic selenocysteine-containing dehydrogenase
VTTATEKPAKGTLHGWRVVHTFGSDELGKLSSPSVELGPTNYVELNPDDAKSLKLQAGEVVTVRTTLGDLQGVLKLDSNLHPGVACAPAVHNPAHRKLKPETKAGKA